MKLKCRTCTFIKVYVKVGTEDTYHPQICSYSEGGVNKCLLLSLEHRIKCILEGDHYFPMDVAQISMIRNDVKNHPALKDIFEDVLKWSN
jgi:hypothetical protein